MSELNLPNQFEIKVQEMILAINSGRGIHKAGNIKASGKPFEDSFRKFLEDSLPSNNKVASGYFYNAQSNCSAEIDVLIYEEKEAFRLDPAPQDQHYVPFTSVSVMGQIKNSTRELDNAIEQVQKSIKSWNEMRQFRVELLTNSPYQFDPVTFIVCGTTSDKEFADLSKTLKNHGAPFPNYILLLDRGLIITTAGGVFDDTPSQVQFLGYRNWYRNYVCKPENTSEPQKGLALMWFYFAIVAKLSLDVGNNLRYHSFCRQFEIAYPLVPIEEI